MPFDLEAFSYFIENPSAWAGEFDQKVSDQMELARQEIERLNAEVARKDQRLAEALDEVVRLRAYS